MDLLGFTIFPGRHVAGLAGLATLLLTTGVDATPEHEATAPPPAKGHVAESIVATIPARKTPEGWGIPTGCDDGADNEGDCESGIMFGDGVTRVVLYDFTHRNFKLVDLTTGRVTIHPGVSSHPLCGTLDSKGRSFLLSERMPMPQAGSNQRWDLLMAERGTDTWQSVMQLADSAYGYIDGVISVGNDLELGFSSDGTLYVASSTRALSLFRDGRPLPRSKRTAVERPDGVERAGPWPLRSSEILGVDATGNTFSQSIRSDWSIATTKRSRDGRMIADLALPQYASPLNLYGSGFLVTPNGDLLRVVVRPSGVTLYRYATGRL